MMGIGHKNRIPNRLAQKGVGRLIDYYYRYYYYYVCLSSSPVGNLPIEAQRPPSPRGPYHARTYYTIRYATAIY